MSGGKCTNQSGKIDLDLLLSKFNGCYDIYFVLRTIHYDDIPLTPGEVKEKMEEAIDDLDSMLEIDEIVIIRKKIDKGGDYAEVEKQIFV